MVGGREGRGEGWWNGKNGGGEGRRGEGKGGGREEWMGREGRGGEEREGGRGQSSEEELATDTKVYYMYIQVGKTDRTTTYILFADFHDSFGNLRQGMFG